MKTRELDEILKRFGRDRAVKEVSELARKATTPREALQYIRWLAELEGWIKRRRLPASQAGAKCHRKGKSAPPVGTLRT